MAKYLDQISVMGVQVVSTAFARTLRQEFEQARQLLMLEVVLGTNL